MRLLEEFLKNYREELQQGAGDIDAVAQFVDNVDKGVSTNSQHPEINLKKDGGLYEKAGLGGQNFNMLALKKPFDSKKLEKSKENVDNVACVRGGESAILPPLLQNRGPLDADSECSLARASDIVDKLGNCGSCPACGHWDGYGPWKMPPGWYCFYSAYFKGKPGKPALINDAAAECPKTM